jgi:hypothetical protein
MGLETDLPKNERARFRQLAATIARWLSVR